MDDMTEEDNGRRLVSAVDVCPICKGAIVDPGECNGCWDGDLGSGGMYFTTCNTCQYELVGWQYHALEDAVSHIRWETNAAALPKSASLRPRKASKKK
ncbi:MAG TPA: hypothetical protein VIM11_08305 [Tepidisphaeraceae bacterium]|jgi:hypothetical protein